MWMEGTAGAEGRTEGNREGRLLSSTLTIALHLGVIVPAWNYRNWAICTGEAHTGASGLLSLG